VNWFGWLCLPLMMFCALMATLDGYGIAAVAILSVWAVATVFKAAS